MKLGTVVSLVCLIATTPRFGFAETTNPSLESRSLRMLEKLEPIANQRKIERFFGAGGSVLSGAALIGLGVGVPATSDGLRITLGISGGVVAGFGVLAFFLPSETERAYFRIKETSGEAATPLSERVSRMEGRFEELAHAMRSARMMRAVGQAIGAGITIGTGIGFLAAPASSSLSSDQSMRAAGWIFLGAGAGFGAATALSLLITSREEDAWNQYRDWVKDPALAGRSPIQIRVSPWISPEVNGLVASISF